MKILKISEGKGYFLSGKGGSWIEIDKIDKDHLMVLLELYLANDVKIDDMEEVELSNQAQRIIYERIAGKLTGLRENKAKFKDECDRMYLKELQKYSAEESQEKT